MQYTLYDNSIDQTVIQKAVDALNNGALIIFPTDSVYSIGCSMQKVKTQEKLAKLKGLKPNQAKFSLLCTDLSQASKFTKPLTSNVFKSIKNNTPGPFTFILNASTEISDIYEKWQHEIELLLDGGYGNNQATTVINCLDDDIEIIREGLGELK